jgi:branched-chain amino acid transport system ATP-binding protein
VSSGWGPTIVVEDIDIDVATTEVVALVGRNGVGKTTLLEAIVGRARCTHGTISLGGSDISRLGVYDRARSGLRHVPQSREVFPSLTVDEHLNIAARPGLWTVARVFDLFPSLAARRSNLGAQLSGGEQQMLAIARAIIANPQMLLMDEPSEGLAPVIIDQLIDALRAVVAEHAFGILLVEQRIDIAAELASRCYIVDRGRIVRSCDSALLKGDEEEVGRLVGL